MGKRALAVAAVVVGSLGLAGCGEGGATTRASQSTADAERDGVIPALAAVELRVRSSREAVVHTEEGEWVISRPTQELHDLTNKDGCRLGPEDGEYAVDIICTIEYAEILLLADGKIRRAYPMPGVPPKWIHATKDAIFAGAVGDGCLPDSTLVRIDRAALTHKVIVFPGDETTPTLMPSWRLATAAERTLFENNFGSGKSIKVTSTIGPRRVNIDGLARLFAAADKGTPAPNPSGTC